MDFINAEEYLLNIPRFTSKNEPDKTRAFLEEIGDFSKTIPTIHVAGTNGKGSVCAYLREGFRAAGLKTLMFTSPHLVDIRERFLFNEEIISQREFCNVFKYVYELVKECNNKEGFSGYHPTFFEFLFFMAAVWIKEKKPDVVLLETGLGGRLDATNSIESPLACIITEIGLDHCEYLGDTKEAIAGEKAGIIKPGVPVIYVSHQEPCDEVIERRAKELNSKTYRVSKENIKNLETTDAGIDFVFNSLYDELVKISLNTVALYQTENSMAAYTAIRVSEDRLGIGDKIHAVMQGFTNMKWPGRMEVLESGLTIDGAHNEDGIKAFLETVSKDKAMERVLLYSAVSDKDIEKVTHLITESGLFDSIYVCELSSYRKAELERLKSCFGDYKGRLVQAKNVKEALGKMMGEKALTARAYAAGSLYLVGEIKSLMSEEE